MVTVSHAEALEAWEQAKEATQEARKRVKEATEQLREAERSLQLLWDAERKAWIEVRNAEWQKDIGKKGEILSIYRKPTEEA
jgi:hypothetical protein